MRGRPQWLAVCLLLACSGEQQELGQTPDTLTYENSPIVFRPREGPGTYFLTLADPVVTKINYRDDIYGMSLSPLRRVVMQISQTEVHVYQVAQNGARLSTFEMPGLFLGWDGESSMLFSTLGTQGVTRVFVDGRTQQLPFPSWVERSTYVPSAYALSPSADLAGFLIWTKDKAVSPDGSTLLVIDTATGAVEHVLPLEHQWQGGQLFWAADGTLLQFSGSTAQVRTWADLDSPPSEPVTLPFDPCFPRPWVTPNTVHVSEEVSAGDVMDCRNSWVIDTDGSNARRREGAPPVAVSPDGKKILLLSETFEMVIANPDGTEQTPIPNTPPVFYPAW